MHTASYDTIVVGLGAMGAACLYQLAKTGQRVLGIDRFSPPHTLGSSHGETRITRRATGEGGAYVPLVTRSHEIWRELEAETGAELLVECGALVMAGRDLPANHHGKPDFVRHSIAVARQFGIPHEVLDAAEITARFPQFGLTGSEIGYYEPGGGFVRPEACIASQLEMAKRHGATLLLNQQVIDVAADGPDATAVTLRSGDRFTAHRVVVAAGAWAAGLLAGDAIPSGVLTRLPVYRQVLHWFAAENPAAFAPDRCPVYIWMHGAGAVDYLYGFPIPAGGDGVKVATEQYTDTTENPDHISRDIAPEEQRSMFDEHVAGRIKGIGPHVLRSAVCMYTVTPDSGFVVDKLPDRDGVLLVSACSGHGFKHSAGLGEALAKRLTGGGGLDAFAAARLLEPV